MTTAVVAMGLGNEIGYDNQLIWHLPRDLKHFKNITEGHPIIMGRKTYESIGKPLPNRTNIVVSRRTDWFQEGILIVGSVKEALKFAKKIDEEVFILGGAELFKSTMEIIDKLEVTVIDAHFEADTFFPEIDEKIWKKTQEEFIERDDKNPYNMYFQSYERR